MIVHHSEMGSSVEGVPLLAVDVHVVLLELSFGLLDVSLAAETDELLLVELGGHGVGYKMVISFIREWER